MREIKRNSNKIYCKRCGAKLKEVCDKREFDETTGEEIQYFKKQCPRCPLGIDDIGWPKDNPYVPYPKPQKDYPWVPYPYPPYKINEPNQSPFSPPMRFAEIWCQNFVNGY